MRARDGAARRQRDAGTLAHLCMSGKGAQDGGTKQRFSSLGLLCRRRGAPSLPPSLPSSLPPSVCHICPCKAPDERLRHRLRKDDSTILPTASCSRTDTLADTAQRMSSLGRPAQASSLLPTRQPPLCPWCFPPAQPAR